MVSRRLLTILATLALALAAGMQRPELGYAWNYQIGRLLSATVYVYNLSVQAIPDGPSSPPVIAQFQRSLEDIREAAQVKHYDQLKVVKGPADCSFGSVVFRCINCRPSRTTRRSIPA